MNIGFAKIARLDRSLRFAAKAVIPLLLIMTLALAVYAAGQDPVPTCAGCGAVGTRNSDGTYTITHKPGCPYGPKETPPPPPPDPKPTPVISVPTPIRPNPNPVSPPPTTPKTPLSRTGGETTRPVSTFESQNSALLNDLKTGAGSSSFDGDKADLLGRMKDGSLTAGPEIARAVVDLTQMAPPTAAAVKNDFAQRQASPNPWSNGFRRSLKINAPPLPFKTFSQIQPGDVLLVHPDGGGSMFLNFMDKWTSWQKDSKASHTFICVRIVNGVKLFLDSQPEEGTRIKSEAEILKRYGGRGVDLAQPISRFDADELWKAARELGIQQMAEYAKHPDNALRRTNFNLYGDDNMVCSESSRWVLLKAGAAVGRSWSPVKFLLGVDYGPANFYGDFQHFLVMPMDPLPLRSGR